MKMSNSSLVSYTKISPNKNSPRNHAIDRITPHCVVGQLSAESICGCFTSPSRQASCNYGIGYDGRISLCVEEKDRSWCSSSSANDHRAVTIECASDKTHPYAMTNAVYASLINLCVDICKRNGKKKLLWFGDKNKTLAYSPKSDEMVLTVHRWFANKSCPGDWLYSRMGDLAAKVTARLGGSTAEEKPASTTTLYRVRKTWADSASQKGAFSSLANAKACADKNPGYKVFDGSGNAVYPAESKPTFSPYRVKVTASVLNIRKGAGTNYALAGTIRNGGVYTIVQESTGQGATKWGKLKSGAGWISLDYTTKVS
ncbi:N-acetylmuramoyl-L-alanine amidase [Gemmiger sp.]|uniref:N-acetylmuramoyl-L-alanine amidase n=1 Tax=Gemmiger sp. TaxID=2049027 RepID=UPI00210897C6|nr:N-acetylmuramoyl-L-alanine amidase [Lacrimispora saccharolytica]